MFNDAQTPADNPGNVDSMSDEHGEPVPDTHADSKAASDTSRRPYRQPPALLAGVATMVVVLLVALVLATFARGSILQKSATAGDNSTVSTTADGMSTTTDAPTTAAASTTTDVPTSTVGSTGGAGDTGGATGTPPGYVPLQVTGLTLTVDQSSVNG